MNVKFEGKTINIYNPTVKQAEYICDQLIKEYIKTHSVSDLDKVQGYDSIITNVVYDIYTHNALIGAIMINYLKNKYEVILVAF